MTLRRNAMSGYHSCTLTTTKMEIPTVSNLDHSPLAPLNEISKIFGETKRPPTRGVGS